MNITKPIAYASWSPSCCKVAGTGIANQVISQSKPSAWPHPDPPLFHHTSLLLPLPSQRAFRPPLGLKFGWWRYGFWLKKQINPATSICHLPRAWGLSHRNDHSKWGRNTVGTELNIFFLATQTWIFDDIWTMNRDSKLQKRHQKRHLEVEFLAPVVP